MKIRLTPSAANELDELLAYIETENPHAARMVAARIEQCFELLTEFPHIGRLSPWPQVREYVVSRLPLIIVYRPHPDEIVVLSVFHTARDPKTKM